MKTLQTFVTQNVFKKLLMVFILTCIFTIVSKDESNSALDHVVYKNSMGQKYVSLYECLSHHTSIINNYYMPRKHWKTSNLGSILFKNVDPQYFVHSTRKLRKYKILIWRHWNWLINRHVYNFQYMNKTQKKQALKKVLRTCSVHNCEFTGENKFLRTADAVVVHIQRGQLPFVFERNRSQRWIMLSDESPVHKFSLARNRPHLNDFNHIFNWTMSYRTDSDVPVPHGRTIGLETPAAEYGYDISLLLKKLVPYWENKKLDDNFFTTILMSNCIKERLTLIKNLKASDVNVHVFGSCAKDDMAKRCPGHFRKDCPAINNYLFYLSIENSKCKQYMTEKVFYNAYLKGAIPVISGPSIEDCEQLLPPNSFLHVESFVSTRELAKEMIGISRSLERIWQFHEWRLHFKVVSEDGYFGTPSQHLCRICEALNYNDGELSIYSKKSLQDFFGIEQNCRA